MKTPCVVVLGKNYSTSLGVIRALGRAGYPVQLLYITAKKGGARIAASSKYILQTIEQIGRNDDEIINRLQNSFVHKGERYVLFPTDDYTSSLIDRYRDVLRPHFLMPYIEGEKQGAVTHYMNKSVQMDLSRKFGLQSATSWEIDLSQSRIPIPQDVSFPCFCKPTISARGYKREICRCNTREELEKKLIDLQRIKRERTVLIQEFLEIQDEFSISGVCFGEDIYLPALLKKLCIAEHEKGVTLLGKVCPFGKLESVKEKLTAMLASIHYYGMIDIELFYSNGELYFNELNFRSSGVGYAVTQAGVNLPAMFVQRLTGQSGIADDKIEYGLCFLYDKAAYEDYIFGHITRDDFENYKDTADFTMLFDDLDTEPSRLFLIEMQKKKKKAALNKIIPLDLMKEQLKRVLRRNG